MGHYSSFGLKRVFILRYRLYVWRYIAYARLRGFESLNDWPYHRRGFIECWAQPGFHRFWQVWNPGITYFVFRLYLCLGGSSRRILATILAFAINGLIHSLVFYLLTRQWSYTIPVLFLLFSVLTILSRLLDDKIRQQNWPWIANTAINILLVIGTFDVSFRVNDLLQRVM